MARVFLSNETYNAATSGAQIFGAAGTEQVNVFSGTTGVSVASSVDRVDLAGNIADFTFSSFGAAMTIRDTAGNIVATVSDSGGKSVVFADGALSAVYAGTTLSLGGVDLTGTAAAITPAAAAIDATTTSDAPASTGGTTGGAAQTFTLTTAVDTPAATANDDTFIGLVDAQTAANSTLTAADTVNGLGGNDTLRITTQGTGAITDAANGAAISNVETIELRAVSTAGVGLSGTNVQGATLINNNLSTDAVTLTNLADAMAIKVTGNGAATNGNTTATYVATATSGELTIDGGVTAGAIAVNGAGLTSLAITSSGAANTTGAISTTGTPTAITINAATALKTGGLAVGTNTASQSLTISGAATNVAATATAAETGAVVLGILDTDIATLDASALTAGGVHATLSAVTQVITGGAGSDFIQTGGVLTTGSVNAGAGTDTLTVADATHIATTTVGAKYTGFEILRVINGQKMDVDLITGSTFTGAVLNDGAATTAITDMNAAMAANVRIEGLAGAATLGIKNATQVGTADTLNLTVSDGDTTGSEDIAGTGDLTIAGVENINITAFDDITLASTANISGMTALTVAGAGDVSITTGAMAAASNLSVDFSGLTAASTFDFSGATGNAILFTGGSGVDTVTDSVVNGNVINAGAGKDVITLTANTAGSGVTTLIGGSGADRFNVGAVKGNEAADGSLLFQYAAGDSISLAGATKGIGADVTDVIDALDGTTLAAAAGSQAEFDTDVQATSVTFQAGLVVLGTTTVTNAGDFLVVSDAAATTQIYQDTDGDRIIEAGEFAVSLTGITGGQTVAGEFTVSGGDLFFSAL